MQRNKDIYTKMFKSNGHFNEEGISLYAEALYYQCLSKLPSEMLQHAEECLDCKMESLEISEIMAEDEKSMPAEDDHPFFGIQQRSGKYEKEAAAEINNSGKRNTFFFLKLAAAILLLIAIGSAAVLIMKNRHLFDKQPVVKSLPSTDTSQSKEEIKINPVLPRDTIQNQAREDHKPEELKSTNSVKKDILADAFVTNTDLERLLVGQTRSSDFKVLNPKADSIYRNSQDVEFQWKTMMMEPLTLKVMDNLGKVKIQKSVKGKAFRISEELRSGLYYWFIGTDEDMLAGGKFKIHKIRKTNK